MLFTKDILPFLIKLSGSLFKDYIAIITIIMPLVQVCIVEFKLLASNLALTL